MAQKRMFSKQIVDSDAFLDMPQSSQLLYFHLNMQADDDGFVGNPKKIIRMMGASNDDFKILIAKRFILIFESGVMVIKHWKLHNYIQSDRYHETQYIDEKNSLITKENGVYTERIQDVSKMDTEVRLELGKVRLDEVRVRESTPAEEAVLFFTDKDFQERIIADLVVNGLNDIIARQEIKKFVSYWTELNKIGTKQRWEIEKTFEFKRRLSTWFSKIKDFKKSESTMAII